jgi:hypothetical protein
MREYGAISQQTVVFKYSLDIYLKAGRVISPMERGFCAIISATL